MDGPKPVWGGAIVLSPRTLPRSASQGHCAKVTAAQQFLKSARASLPVRKDLAAASSNAATGEPAAPACRDSRRHAKRPHRHPLWADAGQSEVWNHCHDTARTRAEDISSAVTHRDALPGWMARDCAGDDVPMRDLWAPHPVVGGRWQDGWETPDQSGARVLCALLASQKYALAEQPPLLNGGSDVAKVRARLTSWRAPVPAARARATSFAAMAARPGLGGPTHKKIEAGRFSGQDGQTLRSSERSAAWLLRQPSQ